MNNKIISLTKIFLKNSFGSINSKKNEIKKKKGVALALVYLFAFLYLAGIMGVISFGMISSLMVIGQEAMFLGILFLAIVFLLLFQTIFTSINIFYFSKDIEFVLPLPLKPRHILMAKFNVILITEYITEFIIGLVPLAIYGLLTGAGPIFYLFCVLILLVFPILPMLLANFIIMIIMSFAKLTKNRDRFQMITAILSIVLIIGMQFFFSSTTGEDITEDQIIQMVLNSNEMVEMLQKYFITIGPSVKTLISSNILVSMFEFIKLLAITFIGYLIYILVGDKLYLKGAIGNLSSGNKNRKNKKIDIKEDYKTKKVEISYVKKEFKTLIRNPIFFMQCLLPPVLMPTLFIVIFTVSFLNESGDIFNELPQFTGIVPICIIIGAIQFFSMMSFIALTAVSRDGENATFMKCIPIPLYKQFIYKMMPDVLMNIFPILITIIAVYIVFKPSILLLIIVFIISMLINILQSYLMLIIDLKKPKLKWDTEYAVVKQNMNMLYEIIVAFLLMGILVIVGVAFYRVNVIIPVIAMIILFGALIYIVDYYVRNNENKLFEKII